MRNVIATTVAAGLLCGGTAWAQQPRPETPPARDERPPVQPIMQLRQARYQIGQMERVLEGAVEHGATIIRDRLAALMPGDMLLTENARARGFRLEGYGVFFDVQVPSLEGSPLWVYQTLNQNSLGVDDAWKTLRSFVETSGQKDPAVQQALRRVELQMGTAPLAQPVAASASTAAIPVPADPILSNPNEAYRAAIREALVDAMLEHTRGLDLGPNEWLTVAARSSDDRPRLAPADPEGQTVLIRLRGADLSAFLAGQISREETVNRLEVRVF